MHALIPPRLFLACLASAIALHLWCDQSNARLSHGLWLGVPLALVGVAWLYAGWRSFRDKGTELHTFEPPGQLVVAGPYRWTRNPMYLGFLGMLLGAALTLGNLCALLSPLLFFVVASLWYIPTEERNCEQTFGEAYRHYRASTRRWI